MSKPIATIKDVAREAGVSISTVSSVVNGNKPVSEDRARRVREAIAKLEFQPNHMARSLHAKRTRTLAYLTPDITNVAIVRTFKAVEAVAHARGYAVFLLDTDGSVEMTREALDRIIGLRMDGAFLPLSWVMGHPEIGLSRLAERGISMVGVSGSYDIADIDCFLHDEDGGGRQIGDYLHRLGHRQVLFVGPTPSRSAERRWSGVRAAYADNEPGSEAGLELVSTGGYSAAAAYDAVQAALAARSRFTAMVAFNDAVATGALAALSDNGLRVPDDVSFVSFGSGHRDFARPQITSVTFDEERIAQLAANRLIDRIEGVAQDAEGTGHIYLPLALTIRQSTRRLA
ncbi:LacI family DNA-binding transcriptional regulator [Devosia sp. LjRoot16]|uniref:LacI family DNA-binding transcriptional regulator n=1 Tax=Devosia sp. LjRoot16 TaxID=3342271 RepID=UPI003ED0E136